MREVLSVSVCRHWHQTLCKLLQSSDTLMAHSEEAQQHYQQRGRDALLLLHLQVPQRLRKVKMVEKIDNICVHAIFWQKMLYIS